MSKKRGKNRPPKIGPAREHQRPVIVAPCPCCHGFVPKDQIKAMDEYGSYERLGCGRCRRKSREIAKQNEEYL